MIIRFLRLLVGGIGLSITAKILPKSMRYRVGVRICVWGGASFVKLGQMLSVRPDIVGQAWADALKLLQDQVPAFSPSVAKRTFESACGVRMDMVFADFCTVPVGSASIAQVHKATLKNGDVVAVKILRPHIRRTFLGDVKVFYTLAAVLERVSKASRRFRLCCVVGELQTWAEAELDLTQEARNAERLRKNLSDEQRFYVPRVYDAYTTEDVLMTEWIDGVRIDDISTIDSWNLNRTQLLRESTRIFFLQVFRDGFFHADIHPGNMFVRRDGVLCPVDFGIMGYMTQHTRIYVADCLYYLYKGDYTRVAEVHFSAGYVPSTYGVADFAHALESVVQERLKMDWYTVSMGTLLADLFRVTEHYQMRVRPELLLLKKTLVVAEGTGRILAPQSSMWDLIADTMEDWMRVNRGIGARLEHILRDMVKTHTVDR